MRAPIARSVTSTCAPQPVPNDLARCISRYRRVLVPELNLGQLSVLVRAEYLVDAVAHQDAGPALQDSEIDDTIMEMMEA